MKIECAGVEKRYADCWFYKENKSLSNIICLLNLLKCIPPDQQFYIYLLYNMAFKTPCEGYIIYESLDYLVKCDDGWGDYVNLCNLCSSKAAINELYDGKLSYAGISAMINKYDTLNRIKDPKLLYKKMSYYKSGIKTSRLAYALKQNIESSNCSLTILMKELQKVSQ